MAFLGLALHIADPLAPKPEMEEFATSPEGSAFITRQQRGWDQAAIAAGTAAEVGGKDDGYTTVSMLTRNLCCLTPKLIAIHRYL